MWASDKGLCWPTDIAVSRGNPSKAIFVPRGYCKANAPLPPMKGWVGWRSIR
jgi:hypothetical protein